MRPLQGRIKSNHIFYKHLIPSGFDYYKINTMEKKQHYYKTQPKIVKQQTPIGSNVYRKNVIWA